MSKSHLIAIASLFISTSTALAHTWTVDSAHSNLGFSVRHMMISNTKGHFNQFSGTAEINDKDLTKSTMTLEIDTSSIDTGDAKRDEHLRSPDFFDASKHAKMVFKSTKIKRAGKGYKVTGELTLHGITKPVTFDATITQPVKTPFGTTVRGVNVTGTIQRKEFGMTWNKALDAGGLAVGDEVKIDVELELLKK